MLRITVISAIVKIKPGASTTPRTISPPNGLEQSDANNTNVYTLHVAARYKNRQNGAIEKERKGCPNRKMWRHSLLRFGYFAVRVGRLRVRIGGLRVGIRGGAAVGSGRIVCRLRLPVGVAGLTSGIRLSVRRLAVWLSSVCSRLCLVRYVSCLHNDELLPARGCEAAPDKQTEEESDHNIADRGNVPVSAVFDDAAHVDDPEDGPYDVADDATGVTSIVVHITVIAIIRVAVVIVRISVLAGA